ncbi:MAG: cytochrome c3 family protein [Planctomycetota bacterium]
MAFLILAGLGFFVLADFSDTSPGPLAAVHEAVPELTGAGGCELCHGTEDGNAGMSAACIACHTVIGAQREAGTGLHGLLPGKGHEGCFDCHHDHLGTANSLVADRAFARAGYASRDAFDHAGLAYGLEGRHAELACRDCHEQADAEVLPEGKTRFLGLTATCASCHEDPHEGKLPDCAACHGQSRPFAEVELFVHDSRFPLTGGHAGHACTECHEVKEWASFAVTKGRPGEFTGTRPVRGCAGCHESPHAPRFLAAVVEATGEPEARTCATCHDPAAASLAVADEAATLRQHDATGFALVPPHADVACAGCHAPAAEPAADARARFARRYPGRAPDDCGRCHGDPHEGQFDASPGGGACLGCHDRARFTPHHFDLARHDKTAFPLAGMHRLAACEGCHKQRPGAVDPERYPEVRSFKGLGHECRSCHEDPHAGRFGTLDSKDCAQCHDERRFTPSNFGLDAHARTGFALEGAHSAVDCASCHGPLPGHRADAPLVDHRFEGTARACAGCHADVHDGAFDRPGLLRVVDGKEGCARCHGQESFRLADRDRFDHAAWTGYALAGAHAKADCAGCHKPGQATHEGTRRMGKASKVCQDCHQDRHAGQFRVGTVTDCARCHDPAHGFTWTSFDHDRDSRFKPGKEHAEVGCASCHRTYPLPFNRTVVRYKPLPTSCKECHLGMDDGGRGRGRGRGRGGDDRERERD